MQKPPGASKAKESSRATLPASASPRAAVAGTGMSLAQRHGALRDGVPLLESQEWAVQRRTLYM
jgi:hypothetical protein